MLTYQLSDRNLKDPQNYFLCKCKVANTLGDFIKKQRGSMKRSMKAPCCAFGFFFFLAVSETKPKTLYMQGPYDIDMLHIYF